MRLNRIAVFTLCSILTSIAAGDNLTFTGNSGDAWDLTASENWGGTAPSADSVLYIGKGGNTFTASKDFSCQAIYFIASSITNVIELDEDRKITILTNGTYQGVKVGSFSPNNNPKLTHTTFKGGIWDLNNTANIGPFYHYSYGKYTNTFVFTDGVVITNVNNFSVGYNSDGHTTILDEKSKVYAKVPQLLQGACQNCTFKILNGSEYHALDGNPSLVAGENAHNNKIIISGENTLLKSKKYPFFGSKYATGNTLIIDDKAEMNIPDFYYLFQDETRGSTKNLVSIRNGGKMNVTGNILLCAAAGTTNNVMEIVNGGEVTVGNIVQWAGTDNYGTTLIISNGTLNCGRVYQKNAVAYNSVFRIIGENSVYNPSYDSTYPIFGCGTGCVFSVEDGASWTYNYSLGFGYTWDCGSFNRVQLLNGGKIKAQEFQVGYGAIAVTNCVIFVGDGSVLETEDNLNAFAANNTIIVSNGTVNVGASMNWGRHNEGFVTTNNTIILQGNKPKINIPNDSLQLRNYATVRFEIPKKGYLTSEPLIYASTIVTANSPSIEITGLEEYQKKLQETTSITLFKIKGFIADGTPSVLSWSLRGVVAELDKTLPEGCSLIATDYDITLKVRAIYRSTTILIK